MSRGVARFIRFSGVSAILAFAGWLLQTFLQLRGVVDLMASRIVLIIIALCIFACGWLVTIGLWHRTRLRIIAAIVSVVVMVGLDYWAPKRTAPVCYGLITGVPGLPEQAKSYTSLRVSLINNSDEAVNSVSVEAAGPENTNGRYYSLVPTVYSLRKNGGRSTEAGITFKQIPGKYMVQVTTPTDEFVTWCDVSFTPPRNYCQIYRLAGTQLIPYKEK